MEHLAFLDSAGWAVLQVRLMHIAARYGLSETDQEDCAQETLLALLLQHPDWGLDDLRTWAWLRSVTCNKAISMKRWERRHSTVHLDKQMHLGTIVASPVPIVAQEADQADPPCPALAGATKVLAGLSEVNLRIFMQHAQEGLDYATISEGLGLTQEQVRKRCSRVIERMRCVIDPLCGHVCVGCRWGRAPYGEKERRSR